MIADHAASDGTPVPTDIAALGPASGAGHAHAGELSVQGIVEANGAADGSTTSSAAAGW